MKLALALTLKGRPISYYWLSSRLPQEQSYDALPTMHLSPLSLGTESYDAVTHTIDEHFTAVTCGAFITLCAPCRGTNGLCNAMNA